MAVESLTCPKCGAPLQIDKNATTTVCSYCNSALRIAKDVFDQATATLAEDTDDSQIYIVEIKRLLQEGKKIEAIKLYREQTGVGLAEAKRIVEALERGAPLSTAVKTVPAPLRVRPRGRIALLGCLPILGVIALCVLVIAVSGQIMFRVFGPLDVVMETVNRDPQVVEALGEPLSPGLFIFGEISGGGSSSSASLEAPIFGPRNSGYLYASGSYRRGAWDLSIWITYEQAGEEREIFITNQ
jgi:hypothetical protein